jgi:uncharacterized protein (TIGR02246 family)
MRTIPYLAAVLILAGPLSAGAQTSDPKSDEQAIRALEARFAAGYRAKDLKAIMSVYAPGAELFVFDASPPRQYVGFDAYKKDWEGFFEAYPGPLDTFEVQDLAVETSGALAFSHSVQHVIATAKDGSKLNLTTRVTDAYRKIHGQWLIVVEHVSIPVDLDTGKGDFASKP